MRGHLLCVKPTNHAVTTGISGVTSRLKFPVLPMAQSPRQPLLSVERASPRFLFWAALLLPQGQAGLRWMSNQHGRPRLARPWSLSPTRAGGLRPRTHRPLGAVRA